MIEIIALEKLYVDSTYQRPIKEPFVRKLATDWNDDLGGVFQVSPNGDDTYAVWDGQQRLEALRRRGESAWWCNIRMLDPAQQADLFARFNRDRKPVTSFDIFKAQTASGDPVALTVSRVLSEVGRVISAHVGTRQHVTAAIGCTRLVARFGEDHFRDVVTALHAAWPDDSYAFSVGYLEGASHCIRRHPDVSPAKFGTSWARVGCRVIAQTATQIKAIGGSMPSMFAYYQAFVAVYNRGRRSGRLEAVKLQGGRGFTETI